MLWLVLLLIPAAFIVALPATWAARALGHRLAALDSPGVVGQVKDTIRRVPNTGGIGIVLGFTLPLLAILAAVWFVPTSLWEHYAPAAVAHLPGVREKTFLAFTVLAAVLALHAVGLIDDRRPLQPGIKFFFMITVAFAIAALDPFNRLFQFLDNLIPAGRYLSVLLTVLWIVAVTNALNFLDNMDGLAGGIGAVAGTCFLAAALLQGQWFVAGCLALLVGALLGFLWFNRPPASIFMGDGGALVLGFLLAFLTVRTTYYTTPPSTAPTPGNSPLGWPLPTHWYAVFMPVIILAVPLYDLVTVTCIRLAQGRSPLVGDLQHISHRLVRRGLSRPAAVGVILGLTAVTGISGILLAAATPLQAILIALQVALLLIVLAAFEYTADVRRMIATGPTPDRHRHA